MAATGATSQQCIAAMVAAVGETELQFQESDGSISPHAANKLVWAVGEAKNQKEVLLRGTSTPWSPGSYSFNVKCELDRSFMVTIDHRQVTTLTLLHQRGHTLK